MTPRMGGADSRIHIMIMIMLAVLTVAASASTYLVMRREAESILTANLNVELQARARDFRQEIRREVLQSVTVATRPFVALNLKALEGRHGVRLARTRLRKIARSFLPMGFSAVAFVNRNGRAVVRAGSMIAPDVAVGIKAREETLITWQRHPQLQVLTPVDDHGRRLGYVATQEPLSFLDRIVPVVKALGRTADLAVCAPLGATRMRCLPDTLHPRTDIGMVSQWRKHRPLPMHFALAGQTGVISTADYRGHRVVAAYAPVGDTGLGMVLKIRRSELFARTTARLWRVGWLLLALLLAGMLLTRWLILPLLRRRTEAEEATRTANARLGASESRLRALLTHVADGVVVINESGIVEIFNDAAEKIFGYEAREMVGTNVNRLMPEPYRSEHDGYLKRYQKTRQASILGTSRELVGVRRNGESFPLVIKVSEIPVEASSLFIAVIRDITEEKETARRIQELATHDALTGLPNRLLLADRLDQAIVQGRRTQTRVALLFLDLDGFKTINDSLGHAIGDLMLKAVAQRLVASLRATDTVARQGGDEFVVILPGLASIATADKVTQKLLARLAAPYDIEGRMLYVGASVGITIYPDDGEDRDTLMKNCDIAMYRAKDAGGNVRLFFRPDMNREVAARQSLGTDLHQALKRDEFRLHYQPVVDFASETIVGLEALVRWQHPVHGLLAPSHFIGLAEETGLIVPIGNWVLAAACAQWRMWSDAGLNAPPIAVNLSARQFREAELAATVTRTLDEYGVDPSALVLEITESMVIGNFDTAIAALDALRATGVQIALDDFGTGYSSLSYLKRLPINTMKIDQSFVRDIASDANDAAVVTAIVALGHSLHMTITAEGVETKEQHHFLRDHGCDRYQGYLFSRPLPPDETAARLKDV